MDLAWLSPLFFWLLLQLLCIIANLLLIVLQMIIWLGNYGSVLQSSQGGLTCEALRHYSFCTVGGSIGGLTTFSARPGWQLEFYVCVCVRVSCDHIGVWVAPILLQQRHWVVQKMSTELLTRSEVFGQLRKELYGEKQPNDSNTHIFIILGASVSTS